MSIRRSRQGRGVFYHRDSIGSHDQSLPGYVLWASTRSRELQVAFAGTEDQIISMVRNGESVAGDLFLDYGVAGNQMSRPALDELIRTIKSDPQISHLFIARRDRLSRPDETQDGIRLERQLRQMGQTIVYMDKVLPPLKYGQRLELADELAEVIDYHETGRFRAELAKKMLYAHARLAKQGFSAGGRASYGFRRWLVDSQGNAVRQLAPGEVVRLAGHHVCWLPGPEEELAVILRILDLLPTMPAYQIAKLLNKEGVPTPDKGRRRKDHGVSHEVSGLWHATSITNIARNKLLVGVTAYGQRSMGDQLRHSANGPRELDERDRYEEDQKLKVIRNPESSVIRAKANFEPLVAPEKHSQVVTILDERGKTQRGKPRSRDPGKNPLGGRIFDLACSSLMYRIPYQDTFRYRCGLYETSHGQQCSHNHVDGVTATRFALAAVQQRICSPEARRKLEDRLRRRVEAEASAPGATQVLKAKEQDLDRIESDLKQATRNLTRAKDDQFQAISEYFDELKAQQEACQKEIVELRRHLSVRINPDIEVASMLKFADQLYQLAEDSRNLPAIGELFKKLNIRMFLRFIPVQKKKRVENKLAGGVLTIGAAASPIDLHGKPTARSAPKLQVKKAAGLDPAADTEPNCSGLEAESLGNVNRDDRI